MPTQKLTAEIIHAAIEGFESQKRRIDSQIDELRQLLNGGSAEPARSPELLRVNGRSAPRDVEEWQQLRRQGGPRSEARPMASPHHCPSGRAKSETKTQRRWSQGDQ